MPLFFRKQATYTEDTSQPSEPTESTSNNIVTVPTFADLEALTDKKKGVVYITEDTDKIYLFDVEANSFKEENYMLDGGSF